MKWLKSLLSEKSDVSSMRIMSFISLFIGAYLALKGQNESVATFIYAAFGGKAVQKYIEYSSSNPGQEDQK